LSHVELIYFERDMQKRKREKKKQYYINRGTTIFLFFPKLWIKVHALRLFPCNFFVSGTHWKMHQRFHFCRYQRTILSANNTWNIYFFVIIFRSCIRISFKESENHNPKKMKVKAVVFKIGKRIQLMIELKLNFIFLKGV